MCVLATNRSFVGCNVDIHRRCLSLHESISIPLSYIHGKREREREREREKEREEREMASYYRDVSNNSGVLVAVVLVVCTRHCLPHLH